MRSGSLLAEFVIPIRVCRDINAYSKTKTTLEPISVYRGHTSVVGVSVPSYCVSKTDVDELLKQDVDWHASKENVFASVGDDKQLMMCVTTFLTF